MRRRGEHRPGAFQPQPAAIFADSSFLLPLSILSSSTRAWIGSTQDSVLGAEAYLGDLYISISEGMDKSWMENWRSRLINNEYKEGVKSFLQKAQVVVGLDNKIRCPCRFCANKEFIQIGLVEEHLFVNGILPSYTRWVFHGERYTIEEVIRQRRSQRVETDNNRIHELLHDVEVEQIVGHENVEEFGGTEGEPEQDIVGGEQFNKLFAYANRELYPGCQSFSKLKFLIRLLHIKTTRNLSNKTMDDLIPMYPRSLDALLLFQRQLRLMHPPVDGVEDQVRGQRWRNFINFWVGRYLLTLGRIGGMKECTLNILPILWVTQ
ncbi:hypothetical protein H6P81_016154 [Aristolochia fimbriata]|uniref:Transposase-associated domain-containing protein n=1 Tax=Aristolochia fimbriata TaxID=158543 RepID=A0AAV7E7W7_ARIFI|nr:hypothetical protein H6P81_016154 [Aristolochia fimbriata]